MFAHQSKRDNAFDDFARARIIQRVAVGPPASGAVDSLHDVMAYINWIDIGP